MKSTMITPHRTLHDLTYHDFNNCMCCAVLCCVLCCVLYACCVLCALSCVCYAVRRKRPARVSCQNANYDDYLQTRAVHRCDRLAEQRTLRLQGK